MLRIEDLNKKYSTGDEALKGVKLEVPKGQVMALIGPSGAGKSTLIRCVNRLVEPTKGKVFLGELELTKLSRWKLRQARRRMGMIFQEYALVERLTVMENVLSGRLGYVGFWRSWFRRFPGDDVREAYRLLDRVGLMEMEPTASLDPKTSRQIMRLINELCEERGLAAIINIHDVLLAQMFSKRIVGLEQGAIVYDGPPEDLTPEVLTRIYGEENWEATIGKVEEEDLNEDSTILGAES